MSNIVSMNLRVSVGGRTFSINSDAGKVNYRDLTESRTGKYVTEKQSALLGKLNAAVEAAVGKLALPAEPAPKAAKAAKAAPKGKPGPKPKAKKG